MYTLLVYAVVWWLAWFIVLPIGIRPNTDPAREEYHAAPRNPNLRKKALWATLLSAILTAAIMLLWNP